MEHQSEVINEQKEFISATKIGSIFGIISFFLTFTIVIPMFSILPAVILEYVAELFLGDSWMLKGMSISIVLFLFLIAISLYFFRKFVIHYKTNRNDWRDNLIIYFILLSLIIHPLFFYLSFAPTWNGLRDGQVIMQTFKTFPISSLSLIAVGMIIDFLLAKTKNITKTN